MRINYIEYSIATNSLDIFFAGCRNRCKDCYNTDLMDFENGTYYKEWLPKISHYLQNFQPLINRIFLVGGSPNHQDEDEMEDFLSTLKQDYPSVPIYAFCGEEIENVNNTLKAYCDKIKTGAYIPNLKADDNIQDGIKLATSNQRVLCKGRDY